MTVDARHYASMTLTRTLLALLALALAGGCTAAHPPVVAASSPPGLAASEPPDSLRTGWRLEEPPSSRQTRLRVTVAGTCPGGPVQLQAIEHEDRIELFAYRLDRAGDEDTGCLAAIEHSFQVQLAEPVGGRKVIQGDEESKGTPAEVTSTY